MSTYGADATDDTFWFHFTEFDRKLCSELSEEEASLWQTDEEAQKNSMEEKGKAQRGRAAAKITLQNLSYMYSYKEFLMFYNKYVIRLMTSVLCTLLRMCLYFP